MVRLCVSSINYAFEVYFTRRADMTATDIAKQLGATIAEKRRSLGLTQAQLGEKLGLPQKDISKMENNPGVVRIEKLYLLLGALELELVLRPRDTPTRSELDW